MEHTMSQPKLTRRQQEIYDYLKDNLPDMPHPPTLDELCTALGLKSRGSLHKQLHALIEAGLIEPMNNLRRGVRLTSSEENTVELEPSFAANDEDELPFYGRIAAGQPISAIAGHETMSVPPALRSSGPCYVLEVKGDSMIEEGIFDGDWVVIEQRVTARNGEIVVALVDDEDATLKRFEKNGAEIILHPANSSMSPMHYPAEMVQVQGVLVGQMRRYH
jgi:repressor LexA